MTFINTGSLKTFINNESLHDLKIVQNKPYKRQSKKREKYNEEIRNSNLKICNQCMKRNAKTTVFAEFPKENSDTGPRKLNVFQFSGSHTRKD